MNSTKAHWIPPTGHSEGIINLLDADDYMFMRYVNFTLSLQIPAENLALLNLTSGRRRCVLLTANSRKLNITNMLLQESTDIHFAAQREVRNTNILPCQLNYMRML